MEYQEFLHHFVSVGGKMRHSVPRGGTKDFLRPLKEATGKVCLRQNETFCPQGGYERFLMAVKGGHGKGVDNCFLLLKR